MFQASCRAKSKARASCRPSNVRIKHLLCDHGCCMLRRVMIEALTISSCIAGLSERPRCTSPLCTSISCKPRSTDPCVGDPTNPALLSTFDAILTPPLATPYYWRHRLCFVNYSVQPVLARTLQIHRPCRRNDRVTVVARNE
jgi:hypothetical protein